MNRSVFYIKDETEEKIYDWFSGDLIDYDDEIITDGAMVNNIECVEVCLEGEISVVDATLILNKWGTKIVSFCINQSIACAC
jgi:hypothetical protein